MFYFTCDRSLTTAAAAAAYLPAVYTAHRRSVLSATLRSFVIALLLNANELATWHRQPVDDQPVYKAHDIQTVILAFGKKSFVFAFCYSCVCGH